MPTGKEYNKNRNDSRNGSFGGYYDYSGDREINSFNFSNKEEGKKFTPIIPK